VCTGYRVPSESLEVLRSVLRRVHACAPACSRSAVRSISRALCDIVALAGASETLKTMGPVLDNANSEDCFLYEFRE
jgi:hypothetical protein